MERVKGMPRWHPLHVIHVITLQGIDSCGQKMDNKYSTPKMRGLLRTGTVWSVTVHHPIKMQRLFEGQTLNYLKFCSFLVLSVSLSYTGLNSKISDKIMPLFFPDPGLSYFLVEISVSHYLI
jgi:hypothetical protein